MKHYARRARDIWIGFILLAIIIKLTQPYFDSEWNHKRSLQKLDLAARQLAVVFYIAEDDSQSDGTPLEKEINSSLTNQGFQLNVVCPINKTIFQYNTKPNKAPEEIIILSLSKSSNGISYGLTRNRTLSQLNPAETAKLDLHNFRPFPALDTK